MNSILVTGGAGFIGSNYVRQKLQNDSDKIVILDALTYAGNLENLKDLLDSSRLKFVHGDVCDAKIVEQIFTDYSINQVVHFAAESHVDRSVLDPSIFIKTNVFGTYVLLEAARKAWVGKINCAFLHVSTDEVYGALTPDEAPFTEDSPIRPSSPYSASKASSDHLAHAWFKTYNLPVMITHCSNNFGAWQFPEKMIPLMITHAIEGKDLPVYGDGMQVRDWLHVDDHCEALSAILKDGKPGETYNIGGETELHNIRLIEMLCDEVDLQTKRPTGTARKLIKFVKDRAGHDRRYAIDIAKIRNELNWAPKRPIQKHLADIIGWYITNRSWCDRVRSGAYREFFDAYYGRNNPVSGLEAQ